MKVYLNKTLFSKLNTGTQISNQKPLYLICCVKSICKFRRFIFHFRFQIIITNQKSNPDYTIRISFFFFTSEKQMKIDEGTHTNCKYTHKKQKTETNTSNISAFTFSQQFINRHGRN